MYLFAQGADVPLKGAVHAVEGLSLAKVISHILRDIMLLLLDLCHQLFPVVEVPDITEDHTSPTHYMTSHPYTSRWGIKKNTDSCSLSCKTLLLDYKMSAVMVKVCTEIMESLEQFSETLKKKLTELISTYDFHIFWQGNMIAKTDK